VAHLFAPTGDHFDCKCSWKKQRDQTEAVFANRDHEVGALLPPCHAQKIVQRSGLQ
jgi:hypothetical protein